MYISVKQKTAEKNFLFFILMSILISIIIWYIGTDTYE